MQRWLRQRKGKSKNQIAQAEIRHLPVLLNWGNGGWKPVARSKVGLRTSTAFAGSLLLPDLCPGLCKALWPWHWGEEPLPGQWFGWNDVFACRRHAGLHVAIPPPASTPRWLRSCAPYFRFENGKMAPWNTAEPPWRRAVMVPPSSTTRSTCTRSSLWFCHDWALNMNYPNRRWHSSEDFLVLFNGLPSKAVLIYKPVLQCTLAVSQKAFSRQPWTWIASWSLPRRIANGFDFLPTSPCGGPLDDHCIWCVILQQTWWNIAGWLLCAPCSKACARDPRGCVPHLGLEKL